MKKGRCIEVSLFRKKISSTIKQKKSLSKQERQAGFLNNGKEAPLCTCRKASYTLEAAVVFPFVAAFLTILLFLFRVLQVETSVQEALVYAGRNTAAVSTATSSDAAALLAAKGFFEKEIADDSQIKKYVKGGRAGILLVESEVTDEYIDLRATYQVNIPIGIFSIKGIHLVSESRNRRWNGRIEGKEKQEDPLVYYTPTGKVYHLSKACPYLDLSIRGVEFKAIRELRNKNDHKYCSCSRCAAEILPNAIVYITDYGTNYHADLNCSGLKRTIYEISLSKAGNRKACSKCGAESK